jgi:hypothetical protein
VTMDFFEANWGFNGAIHGTPIVLKRDPRRNFMENIAFLGLSAGVPYTINKRKHLNMYMEFSLLKNDGDSA